MTSINDTLFLTGAQRSGTTLLAKLLGSQREVSLLSQPFPLLFVEAKRSFLRAMGKAGQRHQRYPLGHLFLESRHEGFPFSEFLHDWRSSRSDLHACFDEMDGYSGQYTRFSAQQRDQAIVSVSAEDDFAATVSTLDHHLGSPSPARWFGSKETSCEEFIPYLLERGFRCLLILRDPRDMVASLNHGRGSEFGGETKPTLFNIRSWRRSVAFALAMEEHPRFRWCRYEDLVRHPLDVLTAFAELLGLERIDGERLADGIRDESGATWPGNSSHGERMTISTASIGTYRETIPPTAVRLIEATSLPEMQLLGYSTTLSHDDALQTLAKLSEPYPRVRSGMDDDLANHRNAALEAERLERLSAQPGRDSARWFLFERAHARLREGFSP